MGAGVFFNTVRGKTAREAFQRVVDEAAYDYGHAGYTGTIAEKHSFVMIELPEGRSPEEYADELIENADPRIDDKWGDAGCIDVGNGVWMFFGWASS